MSCVSFLGIARKRQWWGEAVRGQGWWWRVNSRQLPLGRGGIQLTILPAVNSASFYGPSSDLGQEDPLEKGNGNQLQYSCFEYPMDRGAWCVTVHRVTKSRTQLSNWAHARYDAHTHCGQETCILLALFFQRPVCDLNINRVAELLVVTWGTPLSCYVKVPAFYLSFISWAVWRECALMRGSMQGGWVEGSLPGHCVCGAPDAWLYWQF